MNNKKQQIRGDEESPLICCFYFFYNTLKFYSVRELRFYRSLILTASLLSLNVGYYTTIYEWEDKM